MGSQHNSSFSYNITRPYPFRWFTPVTVVAAILLTALFSYLNYATNGFELVVTTSSDPNATVTDLTALHGLPALLTGKYKPNCQPVSLSTNAQFFTNSTGLRYTILKVTQDAGRDILPTLTYSNNVLEDCRISSIDLDVSSHDRTTGQIVLSAFGIIVQTSATCTITTGNGTVTFDIINSFDLLPSTPYTNFVSQNKTSRTSLWWGEAILSVYWVWSTYNMERNSTFPKDNKYYGNTIRKAGLAFTPSLNASELDIFDPHFFRFGWRMIYEMPSTEFGVYWYDEEAQINYASNYSKQDIYPTAWWQPSEKLAKSAWSTVLADLGQAEQPSVLLDDDKLQRFTSDFEEARLHVENTVPGPERDSYSSTNRTGPLGTAPAVIDTTYICNVPRRKATSTIIWSIIVADLVFLQAVWTVFKLIVEFYLVKREPEAGYCLGCRQGATSRERGSTQTLIGQHEEHEPPLLSKSYLRPGYQRQATEDSRE